MAPAEAAELLDAWLAAAGRTLQPHQRQAVLSAFAAEGLPLWLKLAFEEARHWRSAAAAATLVPDVAGIIRDNLLGRLSAPASHGPLLVARALAYLVASRDGLAEDELLAVLSDDAEVFEEFTQAARHRPPERRLPVVVWSRLFADLGAYLVERAAEGANVLAFYHRQFSDVVGAEFLAGDVGRQRHAALARHFAAADVVVPGESERRPSARKLTELPYQQTRAEMWEAVYGTLTDFAFLERKAAEVGVVEVTDPQGAVTRTYTGLYALLDDYAFALERMPREDGQPASPPRRPPLILTPVDAGDGPRIRCPACQTERAVAAAELGSEIDCPSASCRRELKINPFLIRRQRPPWSTTTT